MCNYSIIIPHYNIPELLVRCLKTIPVRDDVQVIVVDDCSPDADTYIERFPELSRKGVEFYSTDKGGSAGRARNVGLEHAKGEWLIFADADDYFFSDIADVMDRIRQIKADLVYFDAFQSFEKNGQEVFEKCFVTDVINNGIEYGPEAARYDIEVPWCKVISRELVERNNIQFDEISCSNDTWFSVMAAFFAETIEFLPIKAYCWCQRPGSLWRNKTIDWAVTRIGVQIRLAQFMKNRSVEDRYIVHCQRVYYFLDCLRDLSFVQYVYESFIAAYQLRRISYLLSMSKHLIAGK